MFQRRVNNYYKFVRPRKPATIVSVHGDLNYGVRLEGTRKTLRVHHNRLKPRSFSGLPLPRNARDESCPVGPRRDGGTRREQRAPEPRLTDSGLTVGILLNAGADPGVEAPLSAGGDSGGEALSNAGGNPGGEALPNAGGDSGGEALPNVGGDSSVESPLCAGGDSGGEALPNVGGDPAGEAFPNAGGDPGGEVLPNAGGDPGRKAPPSAGDRSSVVLSHVSADAGATGQLEQHGTAGPTHGLRRSTRVRRNPNWFTFSVVMLFWFIVGLQL